MAATRSIRFFTKTIFDKYAREFGERKALALIQNLSESTLLIQALKLWEIQNHTPTYQDLQKVVGAINWFVFSKRETTAVGMLVALSKWDEHINHHKELASDFEVMDIAFNTLGWLKVYLEEVSIWRQKMQFKISTVFDKPHTLYSKILNSHKIENIRNISYGVIQTEYFEKISFPPSEIIFSTVLGGDISGSIFSQFPERIVSSLYPEAMIDDLSNKHCLLQVTATMDSKFTETEATFEVSTPSVCFVKYSDGIIRPLAMKSQSMECIINNNGITLYNREKLWMLLIGGNTNEWVFS